MSKKSKKIQRVDFQNITACSEYLESNWHHWENSRKSGATFKDCMEQSECRAILADGGHWEKGAARMKKAALDIHKIPAGDLEVPERIPSPAGYRPSVGAYLAGSPLSMIRFAPEPQPNRAVKMLVHVGASCGVKHEALMNRGAAIMGAIENLQDEGFAVELTCGFSAQSGNSEFHTTVKVKDFHDTWNPAALAFMLAEPSFFRRSLFAVCNIEQVKDPDSAAEDMGGSLGTPIEKTDNTDFDIEFEALHYNGEWTPDNSAEKAMGKVYEWLDRNKAGMGQ